MRLAIMKKPFGNDVEEQYAPDPRIFPDKEKHRHPRVWDCHAGKNYPANAVYVGCLVRSKPSLGAHAVVRADNAGSL